MNAAAYPTYANHRAFYEATYGQSIAEARDLGAAGAGLLVCKQGAGDWSDAPTPDLVVIMSRMDHAPGRMDVGHGRFIYSGRRNNGAIVAPHVATTIHVDGPHEIALIHVPYRKFRALAPEAKLPEDGDFGALHSREMTDPFYATIIKRMVAECTPGNPHGPMFAEGALIAIAAALLNSATAAPAPAMGGLAPWQVRRAVEQLQADLSSSVSLTDLATTVGLSPFHFARAFKKSTGLPPHRYLMRLRIEKARALLEQTTLSVTEIAFEVGYESSQALARAFTAEMGMNPSRWRRERRA